MSASVWLIIAIVGFSLSGIALVVAIFMFIKMDIPAVVGDLSGKTVAREIKAIKDANSSNEDKLQKMSRVNAEQSKYKNNIYDDANSFAVSEVHSSIKLDKSENNRIVNNKVDVFDVNRLSNEKHSLTQQLTINNGNVNEQKNVSSMQQQKKITEILNKEHGTEILEEYKPVNENYVGTSVLDSENEEYYGEIEKVTFKVTKSIVYIHTDEIVG